MVCSSENRNLRSKDGVDHFPDKWTVGALAQAWRMTLIGLSQCTRLQTHTRRLHNKNRSDQSVDKRRIRMATTTLTVVGQSARKAGWGMLAAVFHDSVRGAASMSQSPHVASDGKRQLRGVVYCVFAITGTGDCHLIGPEHSELAHHFCVAWNDGHFASSRVITHKNRPIR